VKELSEYIRQLRHEFRHESLDEGSMLAVPDLQFSTWLQQAVDAGLDEPQAMVLSTCGKRPSSRVVYLREFSGDQFWFYTNYNSKKSQEITANPLVSLNFYWPGLHRQVRIEGRAERASAEQSDRYFNARPYESKVGAWASNQSAKLASRKDLESAVGHLKRKYNDQNITRPEFWGGFVVTADYYEFWQGRENRLHDRIAFTLQEKKWRFERLSP
jgi:pyridoxamine 5'-phosphate oxidase